MSSTRWSEAPAWHRVVPVSPRARAPPRVQLLDGLRTDRFAHHMYFISLVQHGLVIAYGQTASGKTTTTNEVLASFATSFFSQSPFHPTSPSTGTEHDAPRRAEPRLTLTLTSIELMGKEDSTDLVAPQGRRLTVHFSFTTGRLTFPGDQPLSTTVDSKAALTKALDVIDKRRATAKTGKNARSSRQHVLHRLERCD